MNHSPTPWIANENGHDVIDADGMLVVQAYVSFCDREPLAKSNIERIIACVNACASIPTESLIALNWQLAPVGGARPVDVAALLLKLGEYRKAAEQLVGQAECCDFVDDHGHKLTMNTAYHAIREALK